MIIVGPSGVGKSTLIGKLRAKHPGRFGFSITHTTRALRPGEMHGVQYYRVSLEEFQSMVDENKFVEWFRVHDNMYGTAKSEIERIQLKHKIPLLDIDIKGAEKFVDVFPEANTLFILPPSVDELRKRLIGRGTETEETLKVRLGNA